MYVNINIKNIIIINDKNYVNKFINDYCKDKNINIYLVVLLTKYNNHYF